MLAKLGPTVAGNPTFGLEYDQLAASFAAAKAGRPVAAGSVTEMPLGSGALAGYLSIDVLCHGGVEPVLALKEAHRCLQPGAIAIFNLPAYGWLLSAHGVLEVEMHLARPGIQFLGTVECNCANTIGHIV